MTMKHTPGPYDAQYYEHSDSCRSSGGCWEIWRNNPTVRDGHIIGRLAFVPETFGGLNGEKEEVAAIARLFAAAPELLAALMIAFEILDELPTTQHGPVRLAWEAARAAIAKAGG